MSKVLEATGFNLVGPGFDIITDTQVSKSVCGYWVNIEAVLTDLGGIMLVFHWSDVDTN